MILSNEQIITYSPFSQPSGEYPATFTQSELTEVEALTAEILHEHEWVVPLIPELVIRESVNWYAALFLDSIFTRAKVGNEQPTLIEFKKVAESCLVIYNLKGAQQFKDAFEQACLQQLHEVFTDANTLDDVGIQVVPVQVSSSTGKMAFSSAANFKSWPSELFQGKDVVSLDDIGDRGVTQSAIREKALADGAKSVTTVNMVEKMVPEEVDAEHQKIAGPDIALLNVAYRYLLGWGLDDGTREATRNYETIVALVTEQPADDQIAFQGKNPS